MIKWIPIAEKLPEPGEYILLSFENFTKADIGRYEKDEDGSGAFYLTEKEIFALIDTSGEWIQMMMSGDISTQQEADNRLNEGLGRALKKLYRGRNGERIYKDY